MKSFAFKTLEKAYQFGMDIQGKSKFEKDGTTLEGPIGTHFTSSIRSTDNPEFPWNVQVRCVKDG